MAAPLARSQVGERRQPLFELLPPDRTGVTAKLKLPDPQDHLREYIWLVPFGGICTADFDDDGLVDFYVASPEGGSRLYRNLGDFRFDDVTASTGVESPGFWGTGATFVDIDNDGDLDLYACGYDTVNRLFINEGTDEGGHVHFSEQAEKFGLAFAGSSMTMAFADIDNDGDLDGYLATTARQPPPGVKFAVRFKGQRPVVPDELQEYWQLIYLPGDRAHKTEAGQFDRLYRNDEGRFTDVTREAGIDGAYFTLSSTFWDYNRDNFPDLYVANDYLGPDILYHNNGDGTFRDVTTEVLPHCPWFSMGTDVADVNNDGLIDLFATDMSARSRRRDLIMTGSIGSSRDLLAQLQPRQIMRNALYLNTGQTRMQEAACMTGLASTNWTWNPRWSDFDNDGRVDLFVTNGILVDSMNADHVEHADAHFAQNSGEWKRYWASQPMYPEPNIAMRNLGDLEFRDVGAEWGLDRRGVSFGAATADFDNDGDLDLVVNNADAPVSVYRNRQRAGNSISVRLQGTRSNRQGVGATIDIEAAGLRQSQYVTLARGWLSAVDASAHFGLGDAAKVDRLTVRWPSGTIQGFTDLQPSQAYTIVEPSDSANGRTRNAETHADESIAPQPLFRSLPVDDALLASDPPFDDFSQQPLLPYRLSTPGPAVAWADVDGDGDLDAYLGGATGEPGRLLINRGAKGLSAVDMPDFNADQNHEDAAACWLDIDSDGDSDLYVASGSVEASVGNEKYRDRVYVNDGSGSLSRSFDAVPDLRDSGSVAAPSDFDRDGDVDLFVGSRSAPGKYPLPPASRLLLNQDGRLVEDTDDALQHVGMVTDAVWADVNADQWPDLVIATDWGAVRLLINHDGALNDETVAWGLDERRGWWTAIRAGDLDQDGDVDLIAANFGLNSIYVVDDVRSPSIHYGDFDGSGAPLVLETITRGDKYYPLRGMNRLKAAMLFFPEHIATYQQYAEATLADLFGDHRVDDAQRLQINALQSGVLINNGAGRFDFRPLPSEAQMAPCLGLDLADVNDDGHLDVVMVQNFYGPHVDAGPMDGGVGLLLLGDGTGQFRALRPTESGVVLPGEGRTVDAVDVTGDGRRDLVFGINNGPITVFERLER